MDAIRNLYITQLDNDCIYELLSSSNDLEIHFDQLYYCSLDVVKLDHLNLESHV